MMKTLILRRLINYYLIRRLIKNHYLKIQINKREITMTEQEFISFPKIGQMRNLILDIEHQAQYIGQDSENKPIYDSNKKKPKLKFYGTVKLHGTNSGVSYRKKDGIWAQSRSNIITPENDNNGFAAFVEEHKSVFIELFESLEKHIKDKNTIITIFGEWAGRRIQKGMAINNLPRFYSIFAVKVSFNKENRFFLKRDQWKHLKNHEARIYNIQDWKNWEIEIDFENISKSLEFLEKVVEEVESKCPVGHWFGNDGIGEGVVWVHESEHWGTLRFKTKGEKHKNTKSKKKISIDPEIQKSIDDFIEYAVTENRLNQGIEVVFTQHNAPFDIKMMGTFLSWVVKDIESEEMDVIIRSNLEMKQLTKSISAKARSWFMEKWNKI